MLKPRQRLTIGGTVYRVVYVNFTGAFIEPVKAEVRTIRGHDRKGQPVERTVAFRRPGMLVSSDSIDC